MRHRIARCVGILVLATPFHGAVAQPAAPAGPAVDVEAVCPGAQQNLPATLDLAAHFAWAASDAAPQTRGYVERSCAAWAWARRHAGAGDAAEAQAALGGALVWARRDEQALQLLQDAFPRLLAAQPARLGAAGNAAGLLAAVHMQRAELDAALRWSQQALDLAADPAAGVAPLDGLRLRVNHVAMLGAARRHAQAETLAAELLTTAQAALPATSAEYAALLRAQAMSQRRQEKIDAAVATTRREIAFRLSAQGQHAALLPSDLATAQQNLGSMLEMQGRYDEALQAYREALRSAEAGGPDVWGHLASIPESLSRLLLLRGQTTEALAAAQRAVAMLENTGPGRTARMARPLRHLAQAQLAEGVPGDALQTLRRALALLSAAPGSTDIDTDIAVRSLYVGLLLALGDTAQAQAALDGAQARYAALQPAPMERARFQALRAAVAQRRGQTGAALQALDEADATLSANWPATFPLRVALRVQACDWAARDCTGLQALRPGIADAPLLAQATLALARRAAAADGLALGREAIADAQAASQPDALWKAQAVYAQALRRAGHVDEAIFFGKLSLQTLQGLRDNVLPLGAGNEALFLQDKHGEYRRVADWLLQAGRLPEALQVLRLLKRSEQSDFNERAQPQPSAELDYTAREQRWLRAWPAVPSAPAASVPQAARARAQLPQPADARTVHVYLLAGSERLSALVVGRRGQRVLHRPVGAAALAREVAALLDAVRLRQDVRPQAQALHRHLGPLLDEPARALGARRIVLWLDGPLRYLPPALLHDGRHYLVERYAFQVATPVEPVAAPAAPGDAAPLRVRAWGVTQALGGLPALPGVADELCGIVDGPVRGLPAPLCRGALPGQGDANAGFTEAAWRAAGLADASGGVVHVGTHFVLRPGNVSQSWLLLGDGAHLRLQALRQWPLGAPRLLTLSACETAAPAGVDADGREVDGLASTLLASGARQVLASLWRIDDRATSTLMQRFYAQAARQPADLTQALQTVQRQALREGLPPQVWAAFTLSAAAPR